MQDTILLGSSQRWERAGDPTSNQGCKPRMDGLEGCCRCLYLHTFPFIWTPTMKNRLINNSKVRICWNMDGLQTTTSYWINIVVAQWGLTRIETVPSPAVVMGCWIRHCDLKPRYDCTRIVLTTLTSSTNHSHIIPTNRWSDTRWYL